MRQNSGASPPALVVVVDVDVVVEEDVEEVVAEALDGQGGVRGAEDDQDGWGS